MTNIWALVRGLSTLLHQSVQPYRKSLLRGIGLVFEQIPSVTHGRYFSCTKSHEEEDP